LNAVPPESQLNSNLPAHQADAVLLPDAGWAAMHSALADRKRTSVYFKSSRWGSYNHAHADQNSFVVHADGKVLTGGSGYFDPYAYYGTVHWKNWYQQTKAHNAITFDGGQGQTTQRREAGADILHFDRTAEFAYVSGDATQAYGGTLTKATRTLVFLRKHLIIVYDQLASDKPRRWEWNVHANEPMRETLRKEIAIGNGKSSLCVQQLSGQPTSFSQTDQFSVKPDKEGYPSQWHGIFSVDIASQKAELIFILNVGCDQVGARIVNGVTTTVRFEGDNFGIALHRSGVVSLVK
jgi:hypothetical protein